MLLSWIRIREGWHKGCRRFGTMLKKEDGLGTLEIVLIAAVLIIIAVIFKDWIIRLVNEYTGKAEGKAEEIFQ